MKKDEIVVMNIPLDKIDGNPENDKLFSMRSVDHLAKIIDEEGYTTPIEVYKKKNGRYEITSGHRRYQAMKLLGQKEIPCYIHAGYKTEMEKDRKLLSSNIATRRLSPLEMANAISFYKQILKKENFKGNTRQKIAEYFNISESNVFRYEVLLKLIPELQEFCKKPQFPYSSLRQAASLTKEEQRQLYNELIRLEADTKNISEDEVEKDEIVFSRTRIEQIINGKIRAKENAKKQEELIDDDFPMPKPVEEDSNDLTDLIIKDDSEEVISIETIIENNLAEESSVNLTGFDQCITTLNEYRKSAKSIADKKAVLDKIAELKKALEKLEKSL
ncbi:partitioning protein ParB2 (plasmid) [Butyrivibrio proteoclasticus B316]|uniref:Partitioning protein ParB2 n=1 Tax=Butyrivibrio proteoclasticus (strain ATCC 51982 / DSM 14932 / B316) TaxID=515622 RepID=E0S581_BUTPB|nr:ParB/RepB/Spo0J family partition protein [Butyrivibrio proteoclasticus]ADL36563.1 partitioning protein ParB2 [Butyrivibrio proteoclasticus B316]